MSDQRVLAGNPRLASFARLLSIGWPFGGNASPVMDQYQPLTDTVFCLERQSFGNAPRNYPLVGVALHALNALLVWRLLLRAHSRGAAVSALLGLGWDLALIFPVMGLFDTFYHQFSPSADHLQYLPSVGLLALFVHTTVIARERWALAPLHSRSGLVTMGPVTVAIRWLPRGNAALPWRTTGRSAVPTSYGVTSKPPSGTRSGPSSMLPTTGTCTEASRRSWPRSARPTRRWSGAERCSKSGARGAALRHSPEPLVAEVPSGPTRTRRAEAGAPIPDRHSVASSRTRHPSTPFVTFTGGAALMGVHEYWN